MSLIANLSKHKWMYLWLLMTIIVSVYIIIAANFHSSTWIGCYVSVGGTIIAVAVAILIMIQNNERMDKSTQEQINHIQQSTERQIKTLQSLTAQQMEHFSKLTDNHILTHQEESKKQIKALQETTDAQIKNFIKQTEEITDRLEETSEFLAMISKINEKMLEEERELRRIEEDKIQQRELELLMKDNEHKDMLNRLKPSLQFRLFDDTEALFWHYIFVQIYNGGGDATTIKFDITFKNSYTDENITYAHSFSNIGRGQSVKFVTGRTKRLKAYDIISVQASAWDINQREYFSNLWWYRNDKQWLRIDSQERKFIQSNS